MRSQDMTNPTWQAIELGNYGNKVRTQAMRAGVRALGGKVIQCPHSDLPTLETAVKSGGVRFAYTSGMHVAEKHCRAFLESAGVPLVILDLGYFKRATGAQDRDGYNQVGIGRIGWVPPQEVDSSRWDALGLPDARPPASSFPTTDELCKTVLILGQVPGDTQHGLNERQLNRWYDSMSAPFKADGYEIVFRPHPKHKNGNPPKCDRVSNPTNCTLEKAIAGASHVITYNSTAGLDAILAGIPIDCHQSAHYWFVSDYGQGTCPLGDVMAHMHRLAWSQWTCAEMETGAPIEFLFPDLKPAPPKPMKHLVAIPYFGDNPKYLHMLDEWVANFRTRFPGSEFLVFTHDAAQTMKAKGYPCLELDISRYADVIRPDQPFDVKGALMCEAALMIKRPFLMLDSDALLVADPTAVLDAMGDAPCAMPVDHGAILSGHARYMDYPFRDVSKMCAGVFWFGAGKRAELVQRYRDTWKMLKELDCPWTPRLPHLLEQYAWSVALRCMGGCELPATMNWAPHYGGIGEHPNAIVNHYFGHKKWNGKAPKNT